MHQARDMMGRPSAVLGLHLERGGGSERGHFRDRKEVEEGQGSPEVARKFPKTEPGAVRGLQELPGWGVAEPDGQRSPRPGHTRGPGLGPWVWAGGSSQREWP